MPDSDFIVEYERRHAELETRLARLETIVGNLVTQKDLNDFRNTVAILQESVNQFKTVSVALPTKEEIKYLRWVLYVVAVLVVYHLFGGKLPIPALP